MDNPVGRLGVGVACSYPNVSHPLYTRRTPVCDPHVHIYIIVPHLHVHLCPHTNPNFLVDVEKTGC